MPDNSDQENKSGEEEDKHFAVVTSTNNFESLYDDIENGVTEEPANKLTVVKLIRMEVEVCVWKNEKEL